MFRYLILCLFLCSSAIAAPTLLEDGAKILAEVSGQKTRGYSTQDFGRAMYKEGRSVLVKEEVAESVLIKLRKRLPTGLISFVGVTRNLEEPKPDGIEVVVAEGRDQFDILRVAATDGTNYGLGTEDLIKELKKWDREIGIDIWQAETDTIQIKLHSAPKDPLAFAKRIYKFCPDIVDQGVGSVKELAKVISKDKAVFLWWD